MSGRMLRTDDKIQVALDMIENAKKQLVKLSKTDQLYAKVDKTVDAIKCTDEFTDLVLREAMTMLDRVLVKVLANLNSDDISESPDKYIQCNATHKKTLLDEDTGSLVIAKAIQVLDIFGSDLFEELRGIQVDKITSSLVPQERSQQDPDWNEVGEALDTVKFEDKEEVKLEEPKKEEPKKEEPEHVEAEVVTEDEDTEEISDLSEDEDKDLDAEDAEIVEQEAEEENKVEEEQKVEEENKVEEEQEAEEENKVEEEQKVEEENKVEEEQKVEEENKVEEEQKVEEEDKPKEKILLHLMGQHWQDFLRVKEHISEELYDDADAIPMVMYDLEKNTIDRDKIKKAIDEAVNDHKSNTIALVNLPLAMADTYENKGWRRVSLMVAGGLPKNPEKDGELWDTLRPVLTSTPDHYKDWVDNKKYEVIYTSGKESGNYEEMIVDIANKLKQ